MISTLIECGSINFIEFPLIAIAFLVYLGIVAYVDYKTFKIPNKINLAFALIRIGLMCVYGFSMNSFLGAIVGFLAIFLPAFIMNVRMGGDIKCFTVLGLYLGVEGILWYSILLCFIIMIGTILKGIMSKGAIEEKLHAIRKKFPMGPWLLLTALIINILRLASTIL